METRRCCCQREQIRTEIAVIKRKIGRLLASIENGTDGPDLRELIQQRRREQATQEVRLADLEAQLGMGKVRISDEVLRFMSSQISGVFAARGEGARALLRAVIDRAEIRDGEIKIHYAPEAVMDFVVPPNINLLGIGHCPQGNSNPCLGLERATSWSPRRWGHNLLSHFIRIPKSVKSIIPEAMAREANRRQVAETPAYRSAHRCGAQTL